MRKGGVTVAYSGVHQAYQLALAAEEAGALDCFYCSIFSAPGKWGGLAAWIIGAEKLATRRIDGLPLRKVQEHPFPLAWHCLRSRFQTDNVNDWSRESSQFDLWVSRQLQQSLSRIFVGVETSSERSLQVARELGMITVLDCPGIHTALRDEAARRAAIEWGLPEPEPGDQECMISRKNRELELADWCLVYSSVHKKSFLEQGVPGQKLVEIPLWVEPEFWHHRVLGERTSNHKLKVLYAGAINLRKGVPYLLRGMKEYRCEINLTLVGSLSPELRPILDRYANCFALLPWQSKVCLRDLFWRHEVFVLPSLGDSFGFVAMEAMACGLPVIVTENCGLPVPDGSWRVPVMNSDAIAERLLRYARDRDLCRDHGRVATEFARQFTPQRYRREVKTLFRKWLAEIGSPLGRSPL